MNDLVKENPENNNNIIRSDDAQLDLFFKIHERVNAKKEDISKSYAENILVKFEDLKELHYKTIQSINSLNPAKSSINVRIAISHNEGEAEKFNSFEQFENHNVTSPNPTSEILMVYIFTLYDPESNSFENYKIINQIRSRVAELQQLEKEAPPFISKALIASMLTTTAKITVEYTDYVKARHFTAMFDEWIKGCDESKGIKFIKSLKPFSHLITRFGKLTIYALLAYFTAGAIDTSLIGTGVTEKFIVVYASIFLIVGGIAETFLRKIEMSIDGYLPLSYLNLNKGDSKLIKDYGNRNRNSVLWVAFSLIGTLAISIFTNSVYDIIKWFVLK